MNDKDFSEVRACFKEAGNKKPDSVLKIDAPAGKSVRTKPSSAQHDAGAVSAKDSSKKLSLFKDVKKPLGL